MAERSSGGNTSDDLPSLPMDEKTWQRVARELALSPQQIRIVDLILRGQQDKEIAAKLSLTVPTVRTYLKRVFDRTGVADRISLVLRVFAIAQGISKPMQAHSVSE